MSQQEPDYNRFFTVLNDALNNQDRFGMCQIHVDNLILLRDFVQKRREFRSRLDNIMIAYASGGNIEIKLKEILGDEVV